MKQSYPRVADADIQRDAAAVMLRETQALRTHAGKPADSDLEPMLQAAAAAWRTSGRRWRTFASNRAADDRASGWTDAQIEQLRGVLQPAGFQVSASEGRIVVTRVRPA